MTTHLRESVLACLALALAAGCTSAGGATPEPNDAKAADARHGQSASGPGYVVTLGDSYISGEGVRWAGNTAGAPGPVDALGADAYLDQGKRESTPGCDRAVESVADAGAPLGWSAENLACSGSETSTLSSGSSFKPGLDFFDGGGRRVGQALALQRFAEEHTVEAVVVSIGGNDFGFSSIVSTCGVDFATTVDRRPRPCSDDPTVTDAVGADRAASVTADVKAALSRVAGAMQAAGYARDDYAFIVLGYPSPIATASAFRYPETSAARLDAGGCPVFDADADWANETLLPAINGAVESAVDELNLSNLAFLDLADAFAGHRLCESGVGQLTDTGLTDWQDKGAAAQLEWVNRAYLGGPPWQLQESFHPNYWGMLAVRDCVGAALEAWPSPPGGCGG